MRVLLDLNVVLDVVLKRQPWVADSGAVWNANHSGKIDALMAGTEFTNLFYVVRRLTDAATARAAVADCLATFGCVAVDQTILNAAHSRSGSDFEDDVCIACAVAAGADLIVTRDPTGFAGSPVPSVSPSELLLRLVPSGP